VWEVSLPFFFFFLFFPSFGFKKKQRLRRKNTIGKGCKKKMDICIHIQCFDDRNGLKECSDLLKDIKIITEQRALYYTDISFYEVKKLDDTKTNA
jgi:hypothetical protein